MGSAHHSGYTGQYTGARKLNDSSSIYVYLLSEKNRVTDIQYTDRQLYTGITYTNLHILGVHITFFPYRSVQFKRFGD